ncbi:MAG TPA: precorrin-8X methylmutase [Methanoregulaceae archaeon]|nr:precorrin-8X methylmutase [Methanoregulaceae archaeon]HQJ86931.1 precorrin-8X methylmutase [Methanoregulaceae archaeon]
MASSPREGTTGNTYTDLGATTPEALSISRRSREFARAELGDATLEDRIRQRCSIAVGDLGMAGLLRFRNGPVEAGLEALEAGAPILVDIRMVEVGIQKRGHDSPVICALDYGAELAARAGITRTSAGFRALEDRLEGGIIVIGNAPSALLVVCEQIRMGCRPALVVGTPVGFVNAAESKALLRTLGVPSISNEGTRGGTPVAVAAINEIITIGAERRA